MSALDVVVALATPWGRAALAVVRLSGPGSHEVVRAFARPMRAAPLGPGRPRRVRFVDDLGVVDDGVAWLQAGPTTVTGEDVAELTCHGNPVIVERLLQAAVGAGARLAQAGEFTRRALVHGKVDAVRAEAVLQVIEARSRRGLTLARAGLEGRLSQALEGLRGELVELTAELEARLDYPDDELALVADEEVVRRLGDLASRAEALAATHAAARPWVVGARVALVGAVNAGKSSLFNALLGRTRALVHDTPGTTRDVVEASLDLDGLPVVLLDTAGERVTSDPVEAAGLALARDLVDGADLVVVVVRAREHGPDDVERAILDRTADRARLVVCNGVDQAPALAGALPTVAPSGQGVPALRRALRDALVGDAPGETDLVVASARQRDLLLQVSRCAREAADDLGLAGVAVAADASTRAIEALDELTGADSREEVLDALFARFCIGK